MMDILNLGSEILIMPTLWGILIATTGAMIVSSFRRNKTTIEDDDGDVILEKVAWNINKPRLFKAAGLFVGVGLVFSSIVVVPPGHRGALYTTSGVSLNERNEGFSFMIPIVNNVSMINVREQLFETVDENGDANLFAQTQDVLEVPLKMGVNYIIQPDKAADLFQDVGFDFELAIIRPAVLQVGTQAVGSVDALDLPRERQKLAEGILSALNDRLQGVGITVTHVALEDTVFPSEYTAAVLAKEVAEEQAETSNRLVVVATNEARQAVERATGNAQAIEIEAAAKRQEQELLGMTATEYVWFKTWNGILPSTLLGGNEDFIVNLP